MARRRRIWKHRKWHWRLFPIYVSTLIIGIVSGYLLYNRYGWDNFVRANLTWIYALTILAPLVGGFVFLLQRYKLVVLKKRR